MTPTPTERELALKYALKQLPDVGHYGYCHSYNGFQYDPVSCPGCRRSILEAMLYELTPEPLRGRLVRS